MLYDLQLVMMSYNNVILFIMLSSQQHNKPSLNIALILTQYAHNMQFKIIQFNVCQKGTHMLNLFFLNHGCSVVHQRTHPQLGMVN